MYMDSLCTSSAIVNTRYKCTTQARGRGQASAESHGKVLSQPRWLQPWAAPRNQSWMYYY